jgi:TRAP-type C4-dicarboxylate transport system permease small subunit
MQSFVKREQRVPTKAERRNFATLSTLVSLLLSAVLILGSLALYQVGPLEAIAALQIPAWVIALIILISGLLSWLVIYFFSGFMARQTMKQIEKAKLK